MKNSSKNCIASRLRRRTDNTEKNIYFDSEKYYNPKTSNQNKHHSAAVDGTVANNDKKRELKWLHKLSEDHKNHVCEEIKQIDYSKREKYFNQ